MLDKGTSLGLFVKMDQNKFAKDHKLVIHEIEQDFLPAGQPIDLMKSMIKIALKRPEYKQEMQEFINSLCSK